MLTSPGAIPRGWCATEDQRDTPHVVYHTRGYF